MNIAVVGGSGFIGTRLAENLKSDGVEFFIVDKIRSNVFPEKTLISDVRNLETLKTCLQGADTIVNLAAEHRDDVSPVSLYQDVNVKGAVNICKIAEYLEINHIIFTSSVAVYGFAPPYTDEEGELNPFNEYGRTKMEAEKVYRSWAENHPERHLAIIRPTVVFGEGNRGNVYNLFRQIAGRKFLFVGSGKNHKAMAYVGNVAAFLIQTINSAELEGTWNYVDTPIPDMNELVSSVRMKLGLGKGTGIRIPAIVGILGGIVFDVTAKLSRKKFSISRIRIRKFLSDSSFSADRIKETGFTPPFNLQESLDKVLKYEFMNRDEKNAEE